MTSTRIGNATMDFISAVLSRVPGREDRVRGDAAGDHSGHLTVQLQPGGLRRVAKRGHGGDGVRYRSRAPGQQGMDSLVLIYIPTVPNPTSGNMALVLEDDVIETDLSVEDAMKLVFSGGIVLPEAVSLARVPEGRPGQSPAYRPVRGEVRLSAFPFRPGVLPPQLRGPTVSVRTASPNARRASAFRHTAVGTGPPDESPASIAALRATRLCRVSAIVGGPPERRQGATFSAPDGFGAALRASLQELRRLPPRQP